MGRRLLLFDLDGTLLDAAGAGRAALHRAAAELFGDALDFRDVVTAGRLDHEIFEEAADRAGWTDYDERHHRLRQHYPGVLADELDRRRDRVRALPGVLTLLDRLEEVARDAAAGPVVGCLTGNQRAGAGVKLEAVGIDPRRFRVGAYGDEGRTRPDLVSLAMRRCREATGEAIEGAGVVVVGDTPHDVSCAHAHGAFALAVTTGRYGRAELEAAGADRVADSLEDPGVVLELL
ncbi:MAG: HAD family hydrolase [Planctomycetota bacterium]